MIRVTVLDTETGDTDTAEIKDDYIIVCAGSRYVAGTQLYPRSGTCVITVKRDESLLNVDEGA